LCSSRARIPVFEGIGPIDSERAKALIDDYDGTFDDYEKILMLDSIFLKAWQQKEQRGKKEAPMKNQGPPETRIPRRRK